MPNKHAHFFAGKRGGEKTLRLKEDIGCKKTSLKLDLEDRHQLHNAHEVLKLASENDEG